MYIHRVQSAARARQDIHAETSRITPMQGHPITYHELLDRQRQTHGLSYQQLAERARTTASYVHRLCRGEPGPALRLCTDWKSQRR